MNIWDFRDALLRYFVFLLKSAPKCARTRTFTTNMVWQTKALMEHMNNELTMVPLTQDFRFKGAILCLFSGSRSYFGLLCLHALMLIKHIIFL